jgi:eukaryotic-like serine/threonine-protein kinase
VLYELLTGERLFKGEDSADTLAQVLTKEPDLTEVPTPTRRLIEECLQKDPKLRLRDIGDAKRLLDDGSTPIEREQASRQGRLLPWVAAGVLGLVAAALAFVHFREKAPLVSVQRYTVAAPENSAVHSFAISPDGRSLVIAAEVSGKRQLWLRPLDALQAQPMAFTEDATYPFWSPDSRFIGFFAQGKLKKVAASGGPSQSLCDVPNTRGGSWGRDDVIVFSPTSGDPVSIQRVSAGGGVPSDVTKTKGNQRFPVFLPDGRRFLYSVRGAPEAAGIYVSSLDGTENRRILADESSVVFAPSSNGQSRGSGHILFVRENTLMAQPFDAASAQLAGDVFPVIDGVALANGQVYAPATVSDKGVLVYASIGGAGRANQIAWFDRSGKHLGLVGAPGSVWDPAISPDEKSVVFRRQNGSTSDLWLRDLGRATEMRFTSDTSNKFAPIWSPKGDSLVFASDRKGFFNLFQQAANGSGQDEVFLTNGKNRFSTQWSRDGRFIVYEEFDPKTKEDLSVLPTEGPEKERNPVPYLQTEFNEGLGQLSPDSHWMAYTSDQSGKPEVYVRPFPRAEGQWTISVAGGEQPRWRGDGKELFFEAADGKMMAVPVKAVPGPKPTFEAGVPVALFDAHMASTSGIGLFEYDVTADGKRFLINATGGPGAASSPTLTVVVNWNAELKK